MPQHDKNKKEIPNSRHPTRFAVLHAETRVQLNLMTCMNMGTVQKRRRIIALPHCPTTYKLLKCPDLASPEIFGISTSLTGRRENSILVAASVPVLQSTVLHFKSWPYTTSSASKHCGRILSSSSHPCLFLLQTKLS